MSKERGLGRGLKHKAPRGTRYAPYAQRCLGFRYLAAAWLWLKFYINTN